MVDISKAYPNPVNIDALMETVRATYPEVSQGENGFRVHNVAPENEATVSADLDTIIANHNPATLTTEQQKAVARTLMLSDAKNYLSNQLQSASPNVTNIYNTVKAYVDGNPTLSQMLSNQISLFNTAYGVTINTTTPTAADRTRYLICCQLVLATIA